MFHPPNKCHSWETTGVVLWDVVSTTWSSVNRIDSMSCVLFPLPCPCMGSVGTAMHLMFLMTRKSEFPLLFWMLYGRECVHYVCPGVGWWAGAISHSVGRGVPVGTWTSAPAHVYRTEPGGSLGQVRHINTHMVNSMLCVHSNVFFLGDSLSFLSSLVCVRLCVCWMLLSDIRESRTGCNQGWLWAEMKK